MSGFSVFLTVMLTVGLTTGALYAVYHYVLRQRMEGEIRDIMSQVRGHPVTAVTVHKHHRGASSCVVR